MILPRVFNIDKNLEKQLTSAYVEFQRVNYVDRHKFDQYKYDWSQFRKNPHKNSVKLNYLVSRQLDFFHTRLNE